MDFKAGKWNIAEAFNLDKESDLLDEKISKNVLGDLKKQLGPDGFPKGQSAAAQ